MCWLSPSSLREILNWNTYINNNMCRLVLEADPTDAGSSPFLFFFFFLLEEDAHFTLSLNLLAKVFTFDTLQRKCVSCTGFGLLISHKKQNSMQAEEVI